MMTIKSSDGIEIDVSCNGDIESYKADIHAAFDLIVERIESKVKKTVPSVKKTRVRGKYPTDWTPEEITRLREMFRAGKTYKTIARELKRSESAVKTRIWVENLRGTKYTYRPRPEA